MWLAQRTRAARRAAPELSRIGIAHRHVPPAYDDLVDALWWITVLVAAAVVALIIVTLRRRPRVDPTQLSLDPALVEEVTDLYVAGKRMQALVLLREKTGLSATDAAVIAERLARRRREGA